MSNHACVIFDLDGTLADTKQGIVRGFQYAAKEMGFAYLPQYENSIIGPSLIDSFRHLYGLPEKEARRPYGIIEHIIISKACLNTASITESKI